MIIDPLENGYYNHRYKPKKNGFFTNQKRKSPSDLVEYDFDTDYQLKVPGDWNMQMEKLYYYEGTIWYKKSFDYAIEKNRAVYLYFEAVNYEAKVYLNGELIGSHTGGYTPFQFEVTHILKEKHNFLIVKVDNKRKRESIPTVNTDWWNYGGITRSVYLINVPKNHIADYFVQLAKGRQNTIEGWVALKGSHAGDEVSVRIPMLKKEVKLKVDGSGKATFSIKALPQLWTPENPILFEVIFRTATDEIVDQIAFRTIGTKDTEILLNGESIFLKGISIHEEAPFKTGRVTTVEECRILLIWAKELGCNFVRLAHYPHSESMVREAEKMGLLVWSEIPVYWTVLFDNPETYAHAQQQLEEMITRDKNRGAIILWSVANETPGSSARNEFLQKLTLRVREMDPTRLVTAALDTQRGEGGEKIIDDPLGKLVDVIGINSYCGWYSGEPSSCAAIKWKNKFDKPMIMSEVGGGALQGLHGEPNERWTEEYQEAVYKYNIEMIRGIPFLRGLSPWILMDFR